MLDEIRAAALRQKRERAVRRMVADCKRLLGEKGELGGMAIAAGLIERLDGLDDDALDGYYRVNHRFHSAVQQLAGNRWLDRVTGDLRRFVRLMRGRQLALPGRIEASLNEHRVLMDAFEQRDAARAERAMHDHLMAQLVALKKLRASARTPDARQEPRRAR